MYTYSITGTYTTANTVQSFTATIPTDIRPNGFMTIQASVVMAGEPNCWVQYTAYNNGVAEVYVKSSGANKSTTVYVFIMGTL